MSKELPGQMVLFDLSAAQPDEECEGCCQCQPENCTPDGCTPSGGHDESADAPDPA